jgi:hypothetical protein
MEECSNKGVYLLNSIMREFAKISPNGKAFAKAWD